MANKKTARRAFISSVISLILCCSMLVGTTFAWFTDEVVSSNNIIKSGTLDVEMYYGDTAAAITNDASEGAIFDYQLWEPGYTMVKYVKIANVGNLAFQFRLDIIPAMTPVAGEPNLAEVIDVYMFDATATVDRAAIAAATPVGTLADLMLDADGAAHGYLLPANGVGSDNTAGATEPRGEISYCIVLKMQESAGNEYQDLSVGDGFKVQLLATQYTWENDSFDNTYDENAEYNAAPKADVTTMAPETVDATLGMGGADTTVALNAQFLFKTTETADEAAAGEFAKYHADFVVKADKDVAANSVALAGYYAAYCEDYNDGRWVSLQSDDPITAGQEIRLLALMLNGRSMNYEELCEYVPEFKCGVADLSNGANAGTTLTVELRLYPIDENASNQASIDCEVGDPIIIGTYTYTFE